MSDVVQRAAYIVTRKKRAERLFCHSEEPALRCHSEEGQRPDEESREILRFAQDDTNQLQSRITTAPETEVS